MRIYTFLLLLVAVSNQKLSIAQDIANKHYPYEPASIALPDSLKGEVLQF